MSRCEPVSATRVSETTYAQHAAHLLLRCGFCRRMIVPRFTAGKCKTRFVLANIYHQGRWQRLEASHIDCYRQAGQPYGPTEFRRPRTITQGTRAPPGLSLIAFSNQTTKEELPMAIHRRSGPVNGFQIALLGLMKSSDVLEGMDLREEITHWRGFVGNDGALDDIIRDRIDDLLAGTVL